MNPGHRIGEGAAFVHDGRTDPARGAPCAGLRFRRNRGGRRQGTDVEREDRRRELRLARPSPSRGGGAATQPRGGGGDDAGTGSEPSCRAKVV